MRILAAIIAVLVSAASGQTVTSYTVIGKTSGGQINTALTATAAGGSQAVSLSGKRIPTRDDIQVSSPLTRTEIGGSGLGIGINTALLPTSTGSGITTVTLFADSPLSASMFPPNIAHIGSDGTIVTSTSLAAERRWITTTSLTAASPITLTPSAPNNDVIGFNSSGFVTSSTLSTFYTTPTLQQITDQGYQTTRPLFSTADVGTSGTFRGVNEFLSGNFEAQGDVTADGNLISRTGLVVDGGGSFTGNVSLATLTAGLWHGTAIAPDYGGTGLTSYAVGDLIYATASTTLSKLADVATGKVLISGGVATAPSYGQISNAHVATGAAIAYSKLALTGSVVNADIATAAAIAYSKLALTGSILNADIASGAAIAYAKLALTGSIVNADVSGSAAIAYSKLNLATSIVNGDIGAAAAIAYSKLNLSGSIVNADIASGAAIASSKLATVAVAQGGTGITTYATGDTLYASAANTLSKRTIGSTGDVYTVAGGVPTWAAPGASTDTWQDVVNRGATITGVNISSDSDILAGSFTGNGVAINNLNASELTVGTVPVGVLSIPGVALTGGKFWLGDASDLAVEVAMAGDATMDNTGALSIGTNKVTNTHLRQSAGLSVIGRSANSTGNVADIVAATDNFVLRRSGTSIGFGAVNLASSNAVTGILPIANIATGTPTGSKFVRDDGTLQVPTATEVDTLATVTGRGASASVASTFSGGLSATGGGTGLAVTNNATVGGTSALTGNVTIGNHVQAAATQLILDGTDSNPGTYYNGIVFKNSTNEKFYIGREGTAVSGAFDLVFRADATSNWFKMLCSSGSAAFADRLAVGTGTPATSGDKLQVTGNANVSGTVTATTFSGSGTSLTGVGLLASANLFTNQNRFQFAAGSGVYPVRIDSSGGWGSGSGLGIEFRDGSGHTGHITDYFDGTFTNIGIGGFYNGGYGSTSNYVEIVNPNGVAVSGRIAPNSATPPSSGSYVQTPSIAYNSRATKTSNYTFTTSDRSIWADATSGNVTLTLPAASTCTNGQQFKVVRIDVGVNTVSVAKSGSDTINGAGTSRNITVAMSETYETDGSSAWWVE